MTETATFALGCFWGPDDYFSKLPGVVSTIVGYSGGEKDNPTYTDLGDHSETIEIKFNPKIISYKELLDHFFKQHDSTVVQSTQYKSAIFTHDTEQQHIAEKEKAKGGQKAEKQIVTTISPLTAFYKAEDYHQKCFAKARGEKWLAKKDTAAQAVRGG